ncbi:MAG: hypothetical protein A2Z18_10895 [Armatimonadetes bacterium RBG_16_58_9]|nr:MAG: hypothetical protein A2Z18_10895 [Armatimonadetes bacterium RBG_16_58_9]
MAFLPLDLLTSGAAELGIHLSPTQLDQLDTFAGMLVETNRKLNLTRITGPEDIVTGHYLDSLTCLTAVDIERGSSVIDVGTGAGFPGIPMAVARPDLNLTLLDSLRKRLDFLSEAARSLGLANVETMRARAEDVGRDGTHREAYDFAVTRALANVRMLVELCLPFVKTGGYLIAQKGADIEGELDRARPIIGQLGGKLVEVKRVTIPHSDIERTLVLIEKVKPTPDTFPRGWKKMAARNRANSQGMSYTT